MSSIVIGAVAYDPKVVPIWEGMRDYFREVGPEIDYVLYSNYDSLVRALLAKEVAMGWNTNLAWLKAQHRTQGTCRALAMRDVDARFTTIFVARSDSGVEKLEDAQGKRIAVGSADSAQAAILPVHFLQDAGVDLDQCTVLRFDLDVGKHGDTGTSELEVLRALREGQADIGVVGDTTWARLLNDRKIDPREIQPFWTSPGYCHCNFTVLEDFPEDQAEQWTDSLLSMSYNDTRWRELMELEGLKQWLRASPEIMSGYNVLQEAVEKQGLIEHWKV